MRANKYEKINELMPDIKMSSVNAFVSHVINSTFIPRPVPLRYIVDYKKKKSTQFICWSFVLRLIALWNILMRGGFICQ